MLRTRSLRLRLVVAAALAVTIALAISAVLIARLFSAHVETRLAGELVTHLNQIIASLDVDDDGRLQGMPTLADPRFAGIYSGLYWQIDVAGQKRLRSMSLWDAEMTMPADPLSTGTIHRHDVAGPAGSQLFAIERGVSLGPEQQRLDVRITVAIDRREIDAATAEFRTSLVKSLLIIGTALLIAFAALLHFGLLPLGRLHGALTRVHAGLSHTVEGAYPSEIEELVTDVNRLLDKERRSITQARERAGDLAHGFKTPLAVLNAIARDVGRKGQAGIASDIDAQVEIMQRHVKRELARARMAGGSAVRADGVAVVACVERIVGALRKIGGERAVAWTVGGDAGARFSGDETDLLELVGNVCENAAKWARSRADVAVSRQGDHVAIVVEDDGPGVPAGSEAAILARGKRLDHTADGSGIGLAIVARTVDAYGGTIALTRSPLGGLSVAVTLPAAPLAI